MSHNPYRPPAGELVDAQIVPSANYGQLALAVSLPCVVSVGALIVVPKFTALFEGFGASLPVGTLVLLATYRWWGFLVLATVVMWWYGQKAARSQVATILFGIISAFMLFVFGIWACYAPIFFLAAQA